MRYFIFILISAALLSFSCNSPNEKEGNNMPVIEGYNNQSGADMISSFKPEHPLIDFYIDDKIRSKNKTDKLFPPGVNDLTIDTTEGNLLVSFDRNGGVGCAFRGKLKITTDTVYLEYYEFTDHPDIVITESAELRFYYKIADARNYYQRKFIPKQINQTIIL
jgi:hypothetical protein